MTKYQIYYVGSQDEVAHHAAPLELQAGVRIADPADVVSLAGPNDLAIFFSEHFHRFRQAWTTLNQRGCNTLYAIDGILEWRNAWENRHDEPACPWTMRPVLCDKVACIGYSQARTLRHWGNSGKTEVVGISRFDALINQSPEKRTADGKFRILVTTAKWPGFTADQMQRVTRSLRDLRQYLDQHPVVAGRSVEVIWRLTGGLENELGVENQLQDLSGQELSEVLRNVDAVITTPSTVMLEAMLHGLPLALLDYTNSPRYVDAVWSITAAEQIDVVVSELANPSWRKLFLQRSILEDALQCRESATGRLLRLAEEMIRIGHDCRAANQPVRFPAHILEPVPITSELETDQAWPERPLLTAADRSGEHEAVAAESLRRVNVLQQRIELLEGELVRASEGFDRIASHPVLAPLVKVRKIAMSMGSRIAGILSSDKADEECKTPLASPVEEGVRIKS